MKPEIESDERKINASVAMRLEEVALLLEAQGANTFRVEAYRHAATMLRELKEPIDAIVREQGLEGLHRLPGIGDTLARFIYQLVTTKHLPMLDRLRGESDPIKLLQTVPGIGKLTAERIYTKLGIETLEELEIAAHDGRLARVMKFGAKRLAAIRDSLATRLGRFRPPATRASKASQPSVAELLDVDREYRQKEGQGLLPTVAPKRFNPLHEQWLPILHTRRGDRHYTALFSNTARAHQLNKTFDWVVIYYDDEGNDGQCTVITATYGALAGRRIVRGREAECMQYYLRAVPPVDSHRLQPLSTKSRLIR